MMMRQDQNHATHVFFFVRFIKIVGTHNTVNRMFHVVAVQAFFTKKEFTIDTKWELVGKRLSSLTRMNIIDD